MLKNPDFLRGGAFCELLTIDTLFLIGKKQISDLFEGFFHIYTSSRLGGSPQKHVDIGFWAIFDQKTPSRRRDAPLFDPPVSFRTSWSQFWELSGWKKELKTCSSDLLKTVELEYKTTIEKKMPAHPSRAIIYLASHTPYQNLTRISPKFLGPSNILFDLVKSILRVERLEKRTGNVRIWSFVISRVWKQKNVGKKVSTHCRWTPTHPKNEKKAFSQKSTFWKN